MIHIPQEFEQLKVRDDELDELDNLTHDCAEVRVAGGSENVHGKVSWNTIEHYKCNPPFNLLKSIFSSGQHSPSVSHIEGEGQLVFSHLRPSLRRSERD